MKTRHKLLERQIRRYLKRTLDEGSDEVRAELEQLFDAISQAYDDFDTDRAFTERSQDLSSKELIEAKHKAEDKSRELEVASRALMEAQAKLMNSAKMSALGEMAGGMAHEINTPLAIIYLKADFLKEILAAPEIDREFAIESAQTIFETADRISKIVKGMRLFSSDRRDEPMVRAKVSDVIADTLGLCQERFKNHGVNLRVECESDGEISCRPTEISQILLNLLNNAFDAIESLPEKWIQISVGQVDDDFEISVTDSGTGVPSAVREKIMQPFFTTKAVGKGTGLGLSLSRGIAEAHNGRLTLDPTHPNTRFVLRLPKSAPKSLRTAA